MYPFVGPELFIRGNKYLYLLAKMSHMIKTDWEKCLCCNSILCRNRWNPNYGIGNVLQEVRNNFQLKFASDNLRKRRQEIFYAKLVTNRIFGTHLPISVFL